MSTPAIPSYQALDTSLAQIKQTKTEAGELSIGDVIRAVRQQKGCENQGDMQCVEIFLKACSRQNGDLSTQSKEAIDSIDRNWDREGTKLSLKARVSLRTTCAHISGFKPFVPGIACVEFFKSFGKAISQICKRNIENSDEFRNFLLKNEYVKSFITKGSPEEQNRHLIRHIDDLATYALSGLLNLPKSLVKEQLDNWFRSFQEIVHEELDEKDQPNIPRFIDRLEVLEEDVRLRAGALVPYVTPEAEDELAATRGRILGKTAIPGEPEVGGETEEAAELQFPAKPVHDGPPREIPAQEAPEIQRTPEEDARIEERLAAGFKGMAEAARQKGATEEGRVLEPSDRQILEEDLQRLDESHKRTVKALRQETDTDAAASAREAGEASRNVSSAGQEEVRLLKESMERVPTAADEALPPPPKEQSAAIAAAPKEHTMTLPVVPHTVAPTPQLVENLEKRMGDGHVLRQIDIAIGAFWYLNAPEEGLRYISYGFESQADAQYTLESLRPAILNSLREDNSRIIEHLNAMMLSLGNHPRVHAFLKEQFGIIFANRKFSVDQQIVEQRAEDLTARPTPRPPLAEDIPQHRPPPAKQLLAATRPQAREVARKEGGTVRQEVLTLSWDELQKRSLIEKFLAFVAIRDNLITLVEDPSKGATKENITRSLKLLVLEGLDNPKEFSTLAQFLADHTDLYTEHAITLKRDLGISLPGERQVAIQPPPARKLIEPSRPGAPAIPAKQQPHPSLTMIIPLPLEAPLEGSAKKPPSASKELPQHDMLRDESIWGPFQETPIATLKQPTAKKRENLDLTDARNWLEEHPVPASSAQAIHVTLPQAAKSKRKTPDEPLAAAASAVHDGPLPEEEEKGKLALFVSAIKKKLGLEEGEEGRSEHPITGAGEAPHRKDEKKSTGSPGGPQ